MSSVKKLVEQRLNLEVKFLKKGDYSRMNSGVLVVVVVVYSF